MHINFIVTNLAQQNYISQTAINLNQHAGLLPPCFEASFKRNYEKNHMLFTWRSRQNIKRIHLIAFLLYFLINNVISLKSAGGRNPIAFLLSLALVVPCL
jgi:hypothetical protein